MACNCKKNKTNGANNVVKTPVNRAVSSGTTTTSRPNSAIKRIMRREIK
jgi:hypothetical protein